MNTSCYMVLKCPTLLLHDNIVLAAEGDVYQEWYILFSGRLSSFSGIFPNTMHDAITQKSVYRNECLRMYRSHFFSKCFRGMGFSGFEEQVRKLFTVLTVFF